jgi:hypothetical protein
VVAAVDGVRIRRIGERTFVTIDKSLRRMLMDLVGQSQRALAAAGVPRDRGGGLIGTMRSQEAVLCVLRAALLTRGENLTGPAALTTAFHEQFVRSNLFPGDFATRIGRLFRNRQTSEGIAQAPGANDAREDLQHARVVVSAVTEYMRREGFLGAA